MANKLQESTGNTHGKELPDAVTLLYPNLYFDRFTILQINSSDPEIFMSLEGEKYPRNRVDFVS